MITQILPCVFALLCAEEQAVGSDVLQKPQSSPWPCNAASAAQPGMKTQRTRNN